MDKEIKKSITISRAELKVLSVEAIDKRVTVKKHIEDVISANIVSSRTMEEELKPTKQDLINEMFAEYKANRVVQKSLPKYTKAKFRKFILSNEHAFDEAFQLWVDNDYSDETKPTLVIPALEGSTMKDDKFNTMFEKYVTDNGLQGRPTEELEQLRRNIASTADKMKNSSEYRRLFNAMRNKAKSQLN